MNSDDIERVLTDLRDTNRQLAESSRQIAQSLMKIEESWTAQMRRVRWLLVPAVALMILAIVPMVFAIMKLRH